MGENQTHASNRFQGTPGYAAPEVRSRGRLSLAADVWSFGVLLLELCHGMRYKRIVALQQAEAGGVSEAPAATSHVAGAHAGDREPGVGGASTSGGTDGAPPWAVLPPSCPPQLTALVRSCLSLSPAARPTFDQIVAQLAALLGESRACGSTADAAAASSR
ncbi:hypothetical protein HXX76_009726 [Chlamydomonas incerta]|uniref:Protein kinase domain-containing protein n=1 Tax=Chlamydomonas incerta TaxID=51695 RepID=A0A835SQ74_CHLIN|nr:hypothetical protein HXX76_009726 [Chlamydomonas incerta]|eukprot:KAG2431198.1 hypothetical protein HXX76_009726 [Chlamydomonas incerta]